MLNPFGGPGRCHRVLKLKPGFGAVGAEFVGLGPKLDEGVSGKLYPVLDRVGQGSVRAVRTVMKLSDETMEFEEMFLRVLDDGSEGASRINKAYRGGFVERYYDLSLKGVTDRKVFELGVQDGFDRYLELVSEFCSSSDVLLLI
jgi:hypothetical protein